MAWPVRGSQMRTVLSPYQPAVASHKPSGATATAATAPRSGSSFGRPRPSNIGPTRARVLRTLRATLASHGVTAEHSSA